MQITRNLVNIMLGLMVSILILSCGYPRYEPIIGEPVQEEDYTQKDPISQYTIGVNDVIQVYVRQDAEVSTDYTVTNEGNILIPYLGAVYVEGLTKEQIEKKLAERLSVYIREPEVKVGVREYLSRFVYVIGEVKKPGKVVMKAETLSLLDTIYAVDLPTRYAALKRVLVITPHEEEAEVKKINLKKLLYKGKMKYNLTLKPNDIVFVPPIHTHNLAIYIDNAVEPIRVITSLATGVTYLTVQYAAP